MTFTKTTVKTVYLGSILLMGLAATGCSKVLVLPEGTKDEKNMATIDQKRPKSSASCLSCTINTYAVVTAIDGKEVNTIKYDKIRLRPGQYQIEVTCGSSSLTGGVGGVNFGNSLLSRSLSDKAQIGALKRGDTATYDLDLTPGSKHWIGMWSQPTTLPKPKNTYCQLYSY